VATLFNGSRKIPTDPQRSTPESYEFLLFSCFLLLPIKAYAEVRVEIRGGTTIPTRRYGTSYAEVRFSIRGSTPGKSNFLQTLWILFLRGGTVFGLCCRAMRAYTIGALSSLPFAANYDADDG